VEKATETSDHCDNSKASSPAASLVGERRSYEPLQSSRRANRYPEEPQGLLSLDPQLVCYSRVTGIPDVAQIVFWPQSE